MKNEVVSSGSEVIQAIEPNQNVSVSMEKDTKTSKKGKPLKETRGRNFACVVYPESAPDKWLQNLSEALVPAFVSPLHDADINPNGEPKKPHYHVMVMFQGHKSDDQVKDLFGSFGGVGAERIKDIRAYARYLCHLDNPEKHQYTAEEVKSFGGADYFNVIKSASDKYSAVDEMMDYVTEADVRSFAKLNDYARKCRRDWFRMLCDSCALIMKEYIKSYSWEMEQIEYADSAARNQRSLDEQTRQIREYMEYKANERKENNQNESVQSV